MKKGMLFDNFVRLDNECRELLSEFYEWLTLEDGPKLAPQEASDLAHAADRYLRDFVVDIKERAPTKTDIDLVNQYLANWYIVNTLEPSHEEVDKIAKALFYFHRWAHLQNHLGKEITKTVEKALEAPGYYHERLETFWNLTPEEVTTWRAENDYRKSQKH